MVVPRAAAGVVGLLYIGVLLIPGFYLHLTVSPKIFSVGDDYHYSVVYGSALRLVLGDSPADVRMNFGLISTFAVAFLAKSLAINTFGGWIRLTQSFQLLFLF